MGDVQTRIWKLRERILARYVFKWYDYVTMFVYCFKMGNTTSEKIFPVKARDKKKGT